MEVQRAGPPAQSRLDGRVVAGAILVLLVLVVASLAARGSSWTSPAPTAPSTHTAPARPPAVGSTTATPSATPPPRRENSPLPPFRPPTWVLVAVLAALGAALLVGTARYARSRWSLPRSLRPRGEPPAEPTGFTEPDRRPLADAAERALGEMDQPDARDAVIRSWLMLGEAAAEAGVPPRAAETATEYAARIAGEFYAPVPMLTRLAELYREARFSAHEVTGTQRAESRDLLEQLSAHLEHGRR